MTWSNRPMRVSEILPGDLIVASDGRVILVIKTDYVFSAYLSGENLKISHLSVNETTGAAAHYNVYRRSNEHIQNWRPLAEKVIREGEIISRRKAYDGWETRDVVTGARP